MTHTLTIAQLREAIEKAKLCLANTGAKPVKVSVHPGWLPIIERHPEFFEDLGLTLEVDGRSIGCERDGGSVESCGSSPMCGCPAALDLYKQ